MLRLSFVALLATGAISTAAHAGCTANSGISAGDTVICTGTDTIGIDDGSDDISVIVAPGATIDTTTSGERAINLKDGARGFVRNEGTILSGDEGLQAGDDFIVRNWGTLEAVEKGIDANGSNADIQNFSGARITSTTNEGVEAGDDALVRNDGIIEAFDDAIQVGENATITNTGIIRNTQTQSDLAGGAEAQDAIDIDSGTIKNTASGQILSTTNAAIDFDPGSNASEIDNKGLIKGTLAVTVDDADTASQTVINSGTLEGTSGVALYLGLGGDAVDLKAAGKVLGDVLLGGGDDMLTFTGAGFSGLGIDNLYAGGADTDMVIFDGFGVGDIFDVIVQGQDVDLFLSDGGDTTLFSLTEFEQFKFGTGAQQVVLGLDDLRALAAIPLPAGGLLLLGGLGLLGAARARRRA